MGSQAATYWHVASTEADRRQDLVTHRECYYSRLDPFYEMVNGSRIFYSLPVGHGGTISKSQPMSGNKMTRQRLLATNLWMTPCYEFLYYSITAR